MGVRGWVEGGLASEVVVSWVVGIGHVSSAGMLNALKVYFYNKFQFRRINLKYILFCSIEGWDEHLWVVD